MLQVKKDNEIITVSKETWDFVRFFKGHEVTDVGMADPSMDKDTLSLCINKLVARYLNIPVDNVTNSCVFNVFFNIMEELKLIKTASKRKEFLSAVIMNIEAKALYNFVLYIKDEIITMRVDNVEFSKEQQQ